MFLRHAHWLTLFVVLTLLPGCRRGGPEIPSSLTAEEGWSRLPDQPALEVQRDRTHVLAARVSGGPMTPLVNGMAAVEDTMVLEVAPGQVVVVRQPSAIAKEASSLAHVYIRDGETTLVVTEGFKGEPYVDPKDRKLCWSARTCVNPACPGQQLATAQRPYLYSVRVPQLSVNEKGEVISDGSIFAWPSVACPQCGQVNTTKNYCPDEVSRRREELTAELQKARQLRDQAQRVSP